jgi:hypothetical protein
MKRNLLVIVGLLAFLASIIFYSLTGGEPAKDYAKAISKEREEKDAFMKDDKDSPFLSTKARELSVASVQMDTTENMHLQNLASMVKKTAC